MVGGGPCAYNPEPVADFFDAFAVGDGEDVVHEIADAVLAWRAAGEERDALHARLARVPGVYVPSLFRPRFDAATGELLAMEPLLPGYEKVVRRVVADIDTLSTSAYERPVVPFMQTVHDRLPIELQRGCTRGCRFCQVGMITRPTRQRSPETVLRVAEQGLRASGYEEVGLLSLSSGDYACLNPLLDDFLSRYESDKVSPLAPVAPHRDHERRAGREDRPRPQDRLHARARGGHRAHARGDQQGQPGGGPPHRRGVDLQERLVPPQALLHDRPARGAGRGRRGHREAGEAVPLRRPARPAAREGLGRHQPGRQHLRPQAVHAVPVGADDHAGGDPAPAGARSPPSSGGAAAPSPSSRTTRGPPPIEGALALGDRRVGTAVLHAFRNGQRLDGWSEWFDESRWMAAFARMEQEHGVGLEWFVYRRRRMDEVLPWDRIDCGVEKTYLQKQLAAARNLAEVPDCVLAPCSVCGACDYDAVKNRVYLPEDYQKSPPPPPRPPETPVRTHVRIRYAKEGRLVALSHLEVMHAVLRSVRRAGLPVTFSQGYHPKPRVSFGPALPVGVASTAEFLDLELMGLHDPSQVGVAFGAALPEGLTFLDAREIDAQSPVAVRVRARGPLQGTIPRGLERGGALPENRRLSFGGPVGGAESSPTQGPREEEKPEICSTEGKGDRFEGDGDPPVHGRDRWRHVQLEGGPVGKRQASRGAGGRVR